MSEANRHVGPDTATEATRETVTCARAEDAVHYVLGALSKDGHSTYREHLLEGCGPCGQEVVLARRDVASLDLALSTRAQAASRHEDFEGTRASLGVRLRERVAAEQTAGSAAAQAEPPIPCPPLEPAPVPGIGFAPFERRDWQSTPYPGIRMRVLSADRKKRRWTCLVQMAAGSMFPAHRHVDDEEVLVLRGDLEIGGRVLGRGDYQLASEDSLHEIHTTATGCELLVTSSWENELVLE